MSTCNILGSFRLASAKLRIINHGKRMIYTESSDHFRSENSRKKSAKSSVYKVSAKGRKWSEENSLFRRHRPSIPSWALII